MTEGKHRARHRRHKYALGVAVIWAVAACGVAVWLQPWSAAANPETAGGPLPQPTSSLASSEPEESLSDLSLPPDRSATWSTSPPPGPRFPTGTAVHLIGDSLAVGIAELLSIDLAPRPVTVEAEEGRSTATSVYLLADHAYSTGPIWIVSLGTNDNIEEFAEQAAAIVDLAGAQRCVLWFDVWRPSTDDYINADLLELSNEHPNVHVVPWHDLAEAHTEWFDGEDVHPAQAGYDARMQLASEAVSNYCTS